MCRRRLVPIARLASHDFAEEGDDVSWSDVVEIAQSGAEAEGHEPLEEAHAAVDRFLGQAALLAKVGLVLGTQAVARGRFLLRLGWPLGEAGLDECIDEALQTVAFVDVLVGMHRLERRRVNRCERCAGQLLLV